MAKAFTLTALALRPLGFAHQLSIFRRNEIGSAKNKFGSILCGKNFLINQTRVPLFSIDATQSNKKQKKL